MNRYEIKAGRITWTCSTETKIVPLIYRGKTHKVQTFDCVDSAGRTVHVYLYEPMLWRRPELGDARLHIALDGHGNVIGFASSLDDCLASIDSPRPTQRERPLW